MSVTYTSVLPVRNETVDFLAGLLAAERLRRGTRANTRSLPVHDQAVLILRWFLDGTRMSQLARDNAIGKSTAYALLKTTFRALRNVSVDPWRIGRIVAAAMVLLHFDHARTT